LGIAFYALGLIFYALGLIRDWPTAIEHVGLPILLLLALAVNFLLYHRAKRSEAQVQKMREELERTKPHCLLSLPRSVNNGETFWMEFRDSFCHGLHSRSIQPVVRNVNHDYSQAEQIEELRNTDLTSLKGAVICPAGPQVVEEVISLMHKVGDNMPKLVLHDTSDEAAKAFASEEFGVCIVCVDNKRGGRIAAEILLDNFKKKGIAEKFNVLVMPGDDGHPNSRQRIEGFQERMRELAPNRVNWYYAREGKWTYEGACQAILEFIENEIQNKGLKCLHGIFACNDEMALGVEDTLEHLQLSCCQGVAIVGFDYSHFIRTLWRRKHKGLMVGTVDAKVDAQADAAASLIAELIRGRRPSQRLRMISPERRDRPPSAPTGSA